MIPSDDPTRHPDLRHAAGHLLRLARLARPYWGALGRSVLLGLAVGLLGVAIPYVTKLLIDRVYPQRDVSLLHVLVALIFALSAGSALAGALRGYFAAHVKARLGAALRLLFFNHLQHLPMRFFDTHRVGEVTSRFQGVGRGVDSLAQIFETLFSHGVFLLFVPPVLLWMDPRLGALALAVVPAVATVAVLTSRRLRRLWQESSERHADLSAYQVEVLSRIRTFKGLALERRVFAESRRQMRRAAAAHLRASGTAQVLGGLTSLLRAAGTAAITWFGWTLILGGTLTLGELVAFTTYVSYLHGPLFTVIQMFSGFQESAVHLGRTFEYLDETPEQDPALAETEETHGPALLAPDLPVGGELRLDGVSFGYGDGRWVLRDVDLDFPAGSVTAVVGASGCGKTTLLRLLCAFERPAAGRVLLDERPLTHLPLPLLRRRTSVVWQDAGLVRGTLWHNLTLGCHRPPSRSRVDDAVATCALDELVAGLERGYETPVGEAGATLSAGQQQRVALARALLRDTPVLLLDEATANVDLETERRVLAALLRRAAGRTLIYVTHRLDTARLAHRVAVLERGRLAGLGNHDELETGCAAYRRLLGRDGGDRRDGAAPLRALAGGEER